MGETKTNGPSDTVVSPKMIDLESKIEMVTKENEILKKRCEQLVTKEKNAKDEIKDLKAQLARK